MVPCHADCRYGSPTAVVTVRYRCESGVAQSSVVASAIVDCCCLHCDAHCLAHTSIEVAAVSVRDGPLDDVAATAAGVGDGDDD